MRFGILIADDHAVFRSGLRALLEQETDLTVVAEAGDGLDTIEAAADPRIDILILDISMPGMPGPKVAEAVLANRPDLAIVVLTMHEDEYYLKQLFKIGARAYVLKKSAGSDLICAIRAAVDGERYVDPALAGHVVSSSVAVHPSQTANMLDRITSREREICTLLAYGHTNPEMSQELSISERTVETHRANLMSKLSLRSRAELVRFAIDNGLMKLG